MDSIKMWGLMGIKREIDSMRLKAFYIKSKAPPSSQATRHAALHILPPIEFHECSCYLLLALPPERLVV